MRAIRNRKPKAAEIIQGLSREAQGLVEVLQNWHPTPGSAFPGHDFHGVSQDRADVAGVLAGIKPAALIDAQDLSPEIQDMISRGIYDPVGADPLIEEMIAVGKSHGYVYEEFVDFVTGEPQGAFGKQRNVKALRGLYTAVATLEDWQAPAVHVRVGRLLGYPERNIREFVMQDLAGW